MKRRDFLLRSAGLAGTFLPVVGHAAKPCPPGTLGVTSGTSVKTACTVHDAEADWVSRSTAAGVVWAHDFRNAAEVEAFRSPVNPGEPDTLSWITDDAIGNSKAVQVLIPKGLDDGYSYFYHDSTSGWVVRDGTSLQQPAPGGSNADWVWTTGTQLRLAGKLSTGTWTRPFAAFAAPGNGLPTNDRAAGGAVALRTWSESLRKDSGRFRAGYYAHPDYAEVCRTWPAWGSGTPQTDAYDGSDYWLQFRVKLSYWRGGERGLPATTDGALHQRRKHSSGKLVFIGTTGTTPLHEIVPVSRPMDPRLEVAGARFSAYTGQGYSLEFIKKKTVQGKSVEVSQPGGDFDDGTLAGTCYWDGNYVVRNCWHWSYDEWITLLFHITPGRQQTIKDANPGNADFLDTGVEVWAARSNETSYTKIYGVGAADIANNQAFPFYFDTGGLHPNAWNALLLTGYMNNMPSIRESYHRYTQIIFSKQFIPCPLA